MTRETILTEAITYLKEIQHIPVAEPVQDAVLAWSVKGYEDARGAASLVRLTRPEAVAAYIKLLEAALYNVRVEKLGYTHATVAAAVELAYLLLGVNPPT